MRQTLATIATIGLLITGLTGLTGPADAAPAPETRGEQPVRDLHDEMVKKRGKIFFQGRVDPDAGPVIVQKKACSSSKCPWKRYKKVDTHGPKDRWKVRVYAPRHGSWFWRGYVKASDGYATSWTGKWRTYVL